MVKPEQNNLSIHVKACLYQVGGGTGKDTTLIRCVDSIFSFQVPAARKIKVFTERKSQQIHICNDTSIYIDPSLQVEQLALVDHEPSALDDTLKVISFYTRGCAQDCPKRNWQLSVDGGTSLNTVPAIQAAGVHTLANGAHPAAEIALGYFLQPWLQAGIAVSYLSISYKDDANYAGSVAGTYNKVYLGDPVIPVELFVKASFKHAMGWQSHVGFLAGYAFVSADHIDNTNGTELADKPGTHGGGLTAGIEFGIDYFFNCRFGLGGAVRGQYYNLKGTTQNYSLYAMPVTFGLRYRF